MVILPKEAHGYAAKENILHLLWEQDQFLEKISEELYKAPIKFQGFVFMLSSRSLSFNSNGTSCSKKTTFLSKQLLLNNDFLYNKTVSTAINIPLSTTVN
jgi:hypothetical protein